MAVTIDHFQYCLDQLRRFDHDRYLAILLTPVNVRTSLCALYAFEAEMARIPHSVSEPMLGEIRYQWWRETLDKMKPGEEPSHEIAGAVCETFVGSGVDPSALIPLIDRRALELSEDPFDTLDELVAHVGQVAILGADIAFQLAGQKAQYENSKKEIGKIVTGYGIISHLRRLPIDASRLHLGLPLDLMGKYEIDPHDVFGAIIRPGFSAALGEMLERANLLFREGRDAAGHMSPDLLAILLPTSLTPLYVNRLRRSDFDLFRQSSEIPAFRRQMRYLRVRWRRHL
ncbi:MAG: hypothetical protein COA62_01780 [Rhodobiaceae bacterium]|nr:MAG: hypothetical protein COA62_01780 [Rhodobiaceae bacterium]